jgi:exodeoxyribonuclease V alpha subunit
VTAALPINDPPAYVRAMARDLPAEERQRMLTWLATEGKNCAATAQRNPWIACVDGALTWETAEAWGDGLRRDAEADGTRLAAAIRETLRRAAVERGHTFVPVTELPAMVAHVLRAVPSPADLTGPLRVLCLTDKVRAWESGVALTSLAQTEARLTRAIAEHLRDTPPLSATLQRAFSKRLAATHLTAEQQEATMAAMCAPFSAITGPAGSGKTVLIQQIVQLIEPLGETVEVATPTGKAAEVLVSRGVLNAKTLHSLLDLTPNDTPTLGTDKESGPAIQAGWIILDESTQLDVVIWERFWLRVQAGTRVIAIGDAAQLPPVGAGAVFEDCLKADDILTVRRLETVHRTTGVLTQNANLIRVGDVPTFDAPGAPLVAPFWNADEVPREHLEAAQAALGKKATTDAVRLEGQARWLVDLVTHTIPTETSCRLADVQVLVPQAPGPLGTIHLNNLLRDAINPLPRGEKDSLWWYAGRHHRARPGDAVIATDSLADNIRNGAVGTLERLDANTRCAWIQFAHLPGPVPISRSDMPRLALRYALTVHRMQGSEVPVVVQELSETHNQQLLTRRNLYTGATRAQRVSGFFGSERLLLHALANTHSDARWTAFAPRLRAVLALALKPPPLVQVTDIL